MLTKKHTHNSITQVFNKQYEYKTIIFNLTIFVCLRIAAEKKRKMYAKVMVLI